MPVAPKQCTPLGAATPLACFTKYNRSSCQLLGVRSSLGQARLLSTSGFSRNTRYGIDQLQFTAIGARSTTSKFITCHCTYQTIIFCQIIKTSLPIRNFVSAEIGAYATAYLENDPEFARFQAAAATGNLVPIYERLMGDQLTPVNAYRRLVGQDDRDSPSFLFESVTGGSQQGRYSFVGAHPSVEIIAHGTKVDVLDNRKGIRESMAHVADPLQLPIDISQKWKAAITEGLPRVFTGGWVGYCGYDTVRYVYAGKLAR